MSRSTARFTAHASRFSPPTLSPQRSAIERAPIDDLLVFHIVFGKTVPDISLNAVANLGYADCRFLAPVYPGDTLSAVSEVIGLKENSNRKTGIVYVRSSGVNQRWRHGARLCPLGDGAKARRRRAAPAATMCRDCPTRVDAESLGDGLPADRRRRL